MNRKIYLIIITILIILIADINIFSVPPTVKSQADYYFVLTSLRRLRIMVENFGTDDMRKKYDTIQSLFHEAGENYYGYNFTESQQQFIKVKLELMNFYESMAQTYLDRTKEILDSTSKEAFDIIIKYSKNSGLAQYLRMPFNPLIDVKPLEEDKYHLFHDREKIEAYLKIAYKNYQQAKKIFNDPEIDYLKKRFMKRKNVQSHVLNHIINKYSDIIILCRQAKINGIEIHRLKNINEIGKSLIKYNVTTKSLVPIFDDSIPEKYKVDANDNIHLIHSVEQQRLLRNQQTVK